MVAASRAILVEALALQAEAEDESARMLRGGGTESALLIDLVDGAVGLAEMEITLRSEFSAACEAGCTWCCYQRVSTSPAELLRIVRYLIGTLDSAALDRLVQRTAEADCRTRGLGRAQRLRLRQPCPLLTSDGGCLAYHVRPLPCRGYTSSDAGVCRSVLAGAASAADVDADPVRYLFCQGALNGLDRALSAYNLEGGMVELIAGLAIAFAEPHVMARWWRGEAVFAAAQVAQQDGPFVVETAGKA